MACSLDVPLDLLIHVPVTPWAYSHIKLQFPIQFSLIKSMSSFSAADHPEPPEPVQFQSPDYATVHST